MAAFEALFAGAGASAGSDAIHYVAIDPPNATKSVTHGATNHGAAAAGSDDKANGPPLRVAVRQDRSAGHGGVMWDASAVLARYVSRSATVTTVTGEPGSHMPLLARAAAVPAPGMPLAGLRVLELGAGCGVPGLAAAALGAEVTLTDKPALVPLLSANVRENMPPGRWGVGVDTARGDAGGSDAATTACAPVHVAPFVFGQALRRLAAPCRPSRDRPYDLVLLSDVLGCGDDGAFVALLKSLVGICDACAVADSTEATPTQVLMAYRRRAAFEAEFFHAAENWFDVRLVHEESLEASDSYESVATSPVQVFELRRREPGSSVAAPDGAGAAADTTGRGAPCDRGTPTQDVSGHNISKHASAHKRRRSHAGPRGSASSAAHRPRRSHSPARESGAAGGLGSALTVLTMLALMGLASAAASVGYSTDYDAHGTVAQQVAAASGGAITFHQYIVVGAGPGGLQMAYYLDRASRDYVVLDDRALPGGMFTDLPVFDDLISINKRYTGKDDPEFNMRHDWNSLMDDVDSEGAGPLSMRNYSTRYFPKRQELLQYLRDFAASKKLRIEQNHFVQHVKRAAVPPCNGGGDGEGNGEVDGDGGSDGCGLYPEPAGFLLDVAVHGDAAAPHQFACDYLIMATGLRKPVHMTQDGMNKHVLRYEGVPRDPEAYAGQRVLFLGRGNAAMEIADNIKHETAYMHMLGRSSQRLRLAWETHYVGDIRATHNQMLESYQLKSLDAVAEADVMRFRGVYRDPEDGRLHLNSSARIPQENSPLRKGYDRIINCLGWKWHRGAFAKPPQGGAPVKPGELSPSTCMHDKYPWISGEYESVNVPGLYFAGTLTHSRDFRKTAGGFIHGFRYVIRAAHRMMEASHHGVPWPSERISGGPALEDKLLSRVQRSSGLYQMFGHMRDVAFAVVPPATGDSGGGSGGAEAHTAEYFEEVPRDMVWFMLPDLVAAHVARARAEAQADVAADGTAHASWLTRGELPSAVNVSVTTLSLEFGKNASGLGVDVFRKRRAVSHPKGAARSNFLHPVVRHYRVEVPIDHSDLSVLPIVPTDMPPYDPHYSPQVDPEASGREPTPDAIHHILEDFNAEWDLPNSHRKPLRRFLLTRLSQTRFDHGYEPDAVSVAMQSEPHNRDNDPDNVVFSDDADDEASRAPPAGSAATAGAADFYTRNKKQEPAPATGAVGVPDAGWDVDSDDEDETEDLHPVDPTCVWFDQDSGYMYDFSPREDLPAAVGGVYYIRHDFGSIRFGLCAEASTIPCDTMMAPAVLWVDGGGPHGTGECKLLTRPRQPPSPNVTPEMMAQSHKRYAAEISAFGDPNDGSSKAGLRFEFAPGMPCDPTGSGNAKRSKTRVMVTVDLVCDMDAPAPGGELPADVVTNIDACTSVLEVRSRAGCARTLRDDFDQFDASTFGARYVLAKP